MIRVAKRETAERIDGRPTVEAGTRSDQIAAARRGRDGHDGVRNAVVAPIIRLASTAARCAILTVSLPWPAADGHR